MRITNNMMVNSLLTNMQTNLTKMSQYTSQLSSNRKIVRLSDDPVGVYNALTARQRLARYEQYQRNLVTARSWAEQCETSLEEISSKMAAIQEEVINASTNVKTASDRENIAALMSELRDTVKDALNTTVGDQFIFAGYNTSEQPLTFASDGTTILYNGLDLSNISDAANLASIQAESGQSLQLEVGYGLQMDVTMTAMDVVGVGENNLFKILNDTIDLMNSGQETSEVVDALSGQLGKLSKAHNTITSSLVRAGAVSAQIDILDERYAEDVINYTQIRSNIEDIDSAETIMDWKMAEAVYKQSLSAGARAILPTLMDFLQ
ncbi:MAG: flagellar hook-associated protein 3 [Clostridia bacterium]|nr:flagellar hook-associated protein FlgL [Candidatus Pelethousia sp.]NCB31214.1 flagellar hook-associated protein 3 [Clostridia bacterium]